MSPLLLEGNAATLLFEMDEFEYFLSFEWLRGLLVAQVVRAALNAASRAPPR